MIGLLGASVLLIGAAMLFLPGPAIVVIPVGLAILASEFAWARRLLRKVKKQLNGGGLAGHQTPGSGAMNNKPQERKDHV